MPLGTTFSPIKTTGFYHFTHLTVDYAPSFSPKLQLQRHAARELQLQRAPLPARPPLAPRAAAARPPRLEAAASPCPEPASAAPAACSDPGRFHNVAMSLKRSRAANGYTCDEAALPESRPALWSLQIGEPLCALLERRKSFALAPGHAVPPPARGGTVLARPRVSPRLPPRASSVRPQFAGAPEPVSAAHSCLSAREAI